ncbi:MAG: T9SS type A sorting domain-containing protein [Bacteroidaceae bacterium]|nr:T9SS type A sorting domain-containing protein [Bacteroidaceae bacterium]
MRKLLLLLVFVWTLNINAQSSQNVVFRQTGTQDIVMNIDDLDKIFFEDNTITCKQNNGDEISIDLDMFLGFLLTTVPAAVDRINDTEHICYVDGNLVVNNSKGEIVKLYNLTSLVKEFCVDSDAQVIDLSDLPAGVYIVETESETIKLVK